MNIKDNRMVKFKELSKGDVFIYYGAVCVKVDDVYDNDKHIKCNAVCVEDGHLIRVEPNALTLPAKSCLVLED